MTSVPYGTQIWSRDKLAFSRDPVGENRVNAMSVVWQTAFQSLSLPDTTGAPGERLAVTLSSVGSRRR